MRDIPRKALGAAAVIVDSEGRILLVKHTYGMFNWELPGGYAEENESPMETALREVREETGLRVRADRLSGVYYEPRSPGAGGEMVHFVFLCRPTGASRRRPRPASPEISACGYWRPDDLPRPISDFTIRRISDAHRSPDRLPVTIPPRTWFH